MEIFSELYGCYYSVVAGILKDAHKQGLSVADINKIVEKEAFAETGLHLIPKLLDGNWDLLKQDVPSGLWHSKLKNAVTQKPMTKLQKSWLKAILQDERMRLFLDDARLSEIEDWLKDTEPLFDKSDFHFFDVALDGDDYRDKEYIRNFGTILFAIKNRNSVNVKYKSARGNSVVFNIIPVKLQYSVKDDKFRVVAGKVRRNGRIVPIVMNMGRMLAVDMLTREVQPDTVIDGILEQGEHLGEVILHISKERNALERCMMQFAFYEKETEPEKNSRGYRCLIRYRMEEETELLIRILSFGPVVKVLGPESFVDQIRERLEKQDIDVLK